jgi:GH15 family glucan-1,4-alpha-glucosidase
MKMGVHTYTVATVYAGLKAAANFAALLGKEYEEKQYRSGADEVREVSKTLFNKERNFFYQSIQHKDGAVVTDNTLDASSLYGAWFFGLFGLDEEEVVKSIKVQDISLTHRGDFGGVVRFENDEYYRNDTNSVGNPWIITTLWRAQYDLKKAKTEEEVVNAAHVLEWVAKFALPSGVLPEQIDPKTGEQLSASPLAWSHAEFVSTVCLYFERLKELGVIEEQDLSLKTL